MAHGRAGESVFNISANMEILLPMLILATIVVGRDVNKYIRFFREKIQDCVDTCNYGRFGNGVDGSFYQENMNICGLFWKGFCEKILRRNESESKSDDLLPPDYVV